MIIGLVLLGVIVILMFFGIAQRVFKSFGVTYLAAFAIVGVLIGCAFIPTFRIDGITVSVAGFVAPIVFASVFFALAVKAREGARAVVSTLAVVAVYVSAELLSQPLKSAVAVVLIEGFTCGIAAFFVGGTKISALASVFSGLPIGDLVASGVGMYAHGTPMRFGSAATFDAVILAATVAIVIFEATAAFRRSRNAKRRATAETAEEFDPDEYKKYFDE